MVILQRITAWFAAFLLLGSFHPVWALDSVNPPAPEFKAGLPWLNVSRPLTMKELRGKAVLLDFWTYGCINCIHVIADLKQLEAKYGNKLVVIGVHSPKFDNEKNLDTLRSIVVRYDLEHPVVNDIDFTLGRLYGMRAWPTQVLIAPDGGIVGGVTGEGNYRVLDQVIGEQLAKHVKLLDAKPLPLALEKSKLSGGLLAAPGKIAASAQFVAIADTLHHRILLTDHRGKIMQIYGGMNSGLRDGKAGEARFFAPQGLSFGNGGLYVADTGNHAVRFIDLAKRSVATVAGNGRIERLRGGEFPATQHGLASPWDVSYRDGQLYIAMAGTHQIWKLDVKDGKLSHFAGSGRENIDDGPLATATFSQPSGLSFAGDSLYVADAEDSAVRRIDLRHGKVETLVGSGLFDFGDRDGDWKSARIQHVLGVAALDEKRLLIADTYNHKLKVLDLESRTIKTLAGNGKPESGSGLNEPGGLAVWNGLALVADTNNNRILSYDVKTGKLAEWPVVE